MQKFFLLVIITIPVNILAQTPQEKDSLIQRMCRTIIESNSIDSIKVEEAYDNHLYSFLARFPGEKQENIWLSIFYRFQRNCPEFKNILNRLYPPEDDDLLVEKKPIATISKKDINSFHNIDNFYYIEDSSDTVKLKIKNDLWIDSFKDGTYSKLRVEWGSKLRFSIEFIESNNELRMNFSYPGDKYFYELLEKHESYYLLSVLIHGSNHYEIFKLYF